MTRYLNARIKMQIAWMTLALCAMLVGCSGYEAFFPPLETAKNVDLSRYLGLWYEIAKYPVSFENGCVGVTAEYSLKDDGTIRVFNKCLPGSFDAEPTTIEGTASLADPANTAKLNVSFFAPFAAPYWIIDLDPDYQWAVVGEPSRTTLWILSRTPTLDDAIYQDIISRLPEKGYDPSKLERMPQQSN